MKKNILRSFMFLITLFLSACDNSFVVTYNVQEDTLFYEKECTENELIKFPDNPTIDGYTFEGWFTSSEYLTEVDSNQTCTSNFTFYGKLVSTETNTNSFHIEFIDFDGTILQTDIFEEGSNTSSLTMPSNPTREGYIFDGWSISVPSEMPSKNVTISAIYKQLNTSNLFTIKYLDLDGYIIEINGLESGESTSGIVVPPLPTKMGVSVLGWNQDLPSIMPSEHITIKPIYYNTYSFAKELGNINEHAYYIQGDYILYMVNNWSWSIDESLRDPSTVNVLKISDPQYHRVIDIDKANGYAYSLLIHNSTIIVSSPQKDNEYGTGIIYFFDLEDTTYSYSISQNFSNIHGFGTTLAIDDTGTHLIAGYKEHVSSNDTYYDQFYMIDCSTNAPSIIGVIDDGYISEHPWEVGGVSYQDFYIITKDISTDIIVEVRRFSDEDYIKSFSFIEELSNIGISGSYSFIYYQEIQDGIHTNPLSVGDHDIYYIVDLTVDDPTLDFYQKSDIPNQGTGYISDFQLLEANTYSIYGTSFFDGVTGTTTNSIVIKNNSGSVIETINEKLIHMKVVNNILVVSTIDEATNTMKLYLYDTSDSSSLELIDTELYEGRPEPIIATDGTNYVLLFTDETEEESFIVIKLENLIEKIE